MVLFYPVVVVLQLHTRIQRGFLMMMGEKYKSRVDFAQSDQVLFSCPH